MTRRTNTSHDSDRSRSRRRSSHSRPHGRRNAQLRDQRLSLAVTTEDERIIRRAVEASGTNFSDWARHMLLHAAQNTDLTNVEPIRKVITSTSEALTIARQILVPGAEVDLTVYQGNMRHYLVDTIAATRALDVLEYTKYVEIHGLGKIVVKGNQPV